MFVNIKPMHCLAVIPSERITPGGNVELEESDTDFALLQPGRVALRRVAHPGGGSIPNVHESARFGDMCLFRGAHLSGTGTKRTSGCAHVAIRQIPGG